MFGEALGSLYADKYGMEVFMVRIGNVNPIPIDKRRLSIWFSPRDLAQLVSIGIDHPDIKFEIGVRHLRQQARLVRQLQRLSPGLPAAGRLGVFAEEVLQNGKAEQDVIAETHQGGVFCTAEEVPNPLRQRSGEERQEEMKIKVPKGATDTHMHFYDGAAAAPGTPNPGTFTVPMYRELQKRLGLERVIVVQPNAYKDDNRVTLQSMKELGKGGKGVAVVKPDIEEPEIERLTKAGICAVRIMTLHGGTLGFDVMDQVVARVHPFGWHANIQLDGRELPQYEAQIKRPARQVRHRPHGQVSRAGCRHSQPFRSSAEPGGHGTLLGEALGAVRDIENRRAEV